MKLNKMIWAAISAVALSLLFSAAPSASAALACLRCPTDASGPAVAGGFDVYVLRNGVAVRVTGSSVGACETNLILRAQLNYSSQATGGGVGAGFTGGRYRWRLIERGATLVNEFVGDPTPADIDTVLVTGLNNPLTVCNPPPGMTAVQIEPLNDVTYHVTAADAAAGFLQFFLDATNLPTALLTNQFGNCLEHVTPGGTPSVFIAPPPTCTPPGDQTICQGSSATFTTTATGSGILTYCWQKGCPGAGACLSTSASLTVNNAQTSDGGCYTVTVTDQFGCTTSCQANLTVNPNPSCTITGPTQICPGSTHTYTGTVLPAGGTVTYAWSISGNGTINGSSSGSTVSVTAGSTAPGQCSSYTLSLSVTRNSCPGTPCTLPVNFCQPACSISPPSATLCFEPTQQFTVSTSGTVGTLIIAWTKNGAAFAGNVTTITATAPAAGVTDTYVANVTDSVGCTTSCQATLTRIPCEAFISVEKEVVCIQPPAGCPPENDPGWAKTATGVYNPLTGQYPAFCYRFKVCNIGDVPVVIQSVTDLTPAGAPAGIDLTACNFVGTTIAPGTCTPFCVISTVELRADLTNIFTVCATPTNGSPPVCSTDTNRVHLVPVGIICTKLVSVDGATPIETGGNNNCYQLDGTTPHTLQFSVKICNSGQVPLAHVGYSDPTLGVSGGDFSLAPGECVTADLGSALTITCTNMDNTVTVHGVVDISKVPWCAYDHNGQLIDASSQCSACIRCTPPGACRTTGGGKQDQAVTSHLLPGKTINVDPRANPLQAKFVTHGGQVGAPVGSATEWDPESACIKGEWEHVRHFRPGLDGNFHARKFDSLQCACLACLGDPNPSGVTVPGKHNSLCNPGDRYCGPEPRKAPANKMCFSGIGNYTLDNGRNGRRTPDSVAFRVDIEDHSEPGGSGPKGNKKLPADRYRIRIYHLSGDKNSTASISLRMAIACTTANTPLRDGTTDPLAADGVTTALGDAFPIGSTYVPFVDDGGEIDKGNRQIHPQIKACP